MDQFNKHFILYAAQFFGNQVAWPWFLAQAIAESSLNPGAVSPAGAMGLMQIMPGTSRMMSKKMNIPAAPFDPRSSIQFGIGYDRYLWDIFAKEQGLERLRFVLGAYNAGPGNIIKAQRKADQSDNWDSICRVLHLVTGEDNAGQTIDYVKKIERIRLENIGV